MRTWLIIGILVLSGLESFGQTRRVVCLGSSTTAGANTSFDSSYVGRLQDYFRQITSGGNPDTVVTALATYGDNTYNQLPENYTPPIDRNQTLNPIHNVTEAVNLNPDIIIINLPSNDVADAYQDGWSGYAITETMNNFRVMFNYVVANGIRCFITTTQPRSGLPDQQRTYQRQLRDSIIEEFGLFAINFWDDLVTNDGQNNLKPEVRSPNPADQDYHLNNVGHRYIFQRVVAANIFTVNPLPLLISGFSATVRNKSVHLEWKTLEEEPQSYFEIQRSRDGTHFEKMTSIQSRGVSGSNAYSWIDHDPYPGKNYYRLKLVDAAGYKYSEIIMVSTKQIFALDRVIVNNNALQVFINSENSIPATLELHNTAGSIIYRQALKLASPSNQLEISIDQLPAGAYIILIRAGDGSRQTKQFIKPD